MHLRTLLTFGLVLAASTPLRGQEAPARRLSSIVGVAVEEYSKGIDATGKVTSELEYLEAVEFLQVARGVAERLGSERAPTVRAMVDSLQVIVAARRPPAELAAAHRRFVAALGSEGGLELPTRPLDVAGGRSLYAQNCASCHGAQGRGDGPAARGMTPAPPAIGDQAAMADRTPALLFRVISVGIAGTTMAGWGDRLTADQRWDIVAYLHQLRGVAMPSREALDPEEPPPNVTAAAEPQEVGRRVLATLDQALDAMRAGRSAEAGDLAFDAYIAFEPLETRAGTRDPGLVASVERQFADFKGAVRGNDVREAERARNTIEAQLPGVLSMMRAPAGRWATFLQSFLIILREGVEAILVIGAICAFLMKTGNRDRLRSIWAGTGLALVASAATAIVLQTVLRSMPASREILEGATMLLAVVVLFSVSYWLISKVEAARWQQFIREKVEHALQRGGGSALALVAFLAVYREGAETALFYQALFGEGRDTTGPIVLGIIVGGAALAVIFTLFYRYGVRIPLRPFFAVTSVVLYYMAFVFAGKGVRELQEGDVIPITTIPGFPSIDAMGIYNSIETLLAQLVLLALFVFALVKTFWPRQAADTSPNSAVIVSDT